VKAIYVVACAGALLASCMETQSAKPIGKERAIQIAKASCLHGTEEGPWTASLNETNWLVRENLGPKKTFGRCNWRWEVKVDASTGETGPCGICIPQTDGIPVRR